MYSAKVIARAIAQYEAKANHSLVEIDRGKVSEWIEHLASLWDPEKHELRRTLRDEESKFIRNERVMSMLNFRYWAERYAMLQCEPSGIDKFTSPWESQEILLRFIARLEEEQQAAAARGEPTDGILVALCKARQLGATALGRLLLMHRLLTQPNRRAMSASVDDDKIQELYDRDKLIYDHLPWYLKPQLRYDEKRQHLHFDELDSRSLYQVSSQKSGLGVGRQFDIAHLTELSTWLYGNLEMQFFPTLPQTASTLALLESTANGRGGWWHDFTNRVRMGVSKRWHVVFIPWYAEASKYRRQPPEDWQPSQLTLLHAQKVWETSAEFMGRQVMLAKPQLYWWETTRAEHQQGNSLGDFLANYCATYEESFQHSGQGAFSPELLEYLRLHTSLGTPYELRQGA